MGAAYGCRFAVELPEHLCEIAELRLPYGWEPLLERAADPAPTWLLQPLGAFGTAGWTAVARGLTLGEPAPAEIALERLLDDLEEWVAVHAHGLVFVRAGAVAWRDRAILLPGGSLAGKTTLVAALVRAGAGYLSDAWAVIRPDGLLQPYPRRLSMRPPGGSVRRSTPVTALGGVTRREPLPIGLVAQLGYDAEADWSVTEMPPGGAALALVSCAAAAAERPADVVAAVDGALRDARGIAGTRGEAGDAARRLLHGPWSGWE